MIRSHYSREIKPSMDGEKITIAGWVQNIRVLGSIAFLKIRDREGLSQVTITKDNSSFEIVKELTPESVVAVTGAVKKSEKAQNGWELIPEEVKVLSKAEAPLPLDISGKIESEVETRLNARFMDLRNPRVAAIFAIRDCVTTAIRNYAESNDLIEVHTPKIVGAGAEGGALLFPVDYFGKKAFLSQSPQLYKQMLMATDFDRIYEIAPYFRAEKSDTSRHVAEFVMWDVEMAFIESQEEIMNFLEEGVKHVYEHVRKHRGEELEILGVDLEIPKTPFPRVTYSEAIEKLGMKQEQEIGAEEEKKLGLMMKEEEKTNLYFITMFPESEKPFYIMEAESGLSYSFDLELGGQELCSGGQREHRYGELVKRMKKKGLNPSDFAFYLNAFKYGMPPHGGFGLGVDRLVQKMLDIPNIREVVLHPRDLKRVLP